MEARERFYVVRTGTTTIRAANLDAYEHDVITGHRWWTPGEIAASTDVFVPRRLAELLPPLLAGRYPAQPLVIGP